MKSVPQPGDLIAVYMTAASKAEARRLARVLVEEKLAACVNVLGQIESVYRWKGRVENGSEVALIAKTRRSKLPKLIALVKDLHSYEVPCIVALPIKGGNKDFLAWIANSLAR